MKEKRYQQEVEQVTLEVCELKRRLGILEDNLTKSQNNELELTHQVNSQRQQLQQHVLKYNNVVESYEKTRKHIEKEVRSSEE